MKRLKIYSLIVASICAVSLITGCSTTTGTSARVSHSGFDDARVVTIAPHGNIPENMMSMIGTGIGAQWSEEHPDHVLLIITVMNDYTGITGAELNIDGEKITLASSAGVTDIGSAGDIMKQSTKGFVTDLQTVQKIIDSKRTWLRISTPTGTMENAVIDGDKDSKAYHALIRFMDAVKSEEV